jgi:peptidoglycan/xylan/chitin deacetylase (PgdA/CDA1 family)
MTSSALLKTCFEVMHYSGAAHLLAPVFRGKGIIFCLHHVCPGGGLQKGFAPNYQLEVTPEFLDDVIRLSVEKGYDLISMDDVADRLSHPKSNQNPFVSFTLDDGYRDNMVHAAPVFRKRNCPYTIYVSPRIAEGTCELWWRGLEAIIAGAQHISCTIGGFEFSLDTHDDGRKWTAWNKIFPLLKALPEYEQRIWIRQESLKHGIDLDAYCRSVSMTWDDIRRLNADPLCTIGAHTLNHYAVARLDRSDAAREIGDSGRLLAEHLGEKPRHFAYPYGDEPAATARDFEIAQEAGYLAAVTTRKGVIFQEHSSHMHGLPRVILSGRYQKLRYVDALMSGAPFALMNGFRKVNVN